MSRPAGVGNRLQQFENRLQKALAGAIESVAYNRLQQFVNSAGLVYALERRWNRSFMMS